MATVDRQSVDVDVGGYPWPDWAGLCSLDWAPYDRARRALWPPLKVAATLAAARLHETATRYPMVTWREVGLRYGFPDMSGAGDVVASAVRAYCLEEGCVYPRRDRSGRRTAVAPQEALA